MNWTVTLRSDLELDEIRALSIQSPAPILLDVRTVEEVAEGILPGALHIPIDELQHRLDEINSFKDRTILCYCRVGGRSDFGAHFLREQGFQAYNVGGYLDLVQLFEK